MAAMSRLLLGVEFGVDGLKWAMPLGQGLDRLIATPVGYKLLPG